MEHTVRAYDEDLDAITAELARMGGLAEAEVADSVRAIAERDIALAETVIARDARLDTLERDIEQKAIRLIALRQPVADDLRRTVGAMKISTNLERCGDLAKNIAKRALVLNREPPIRLTQSLARMGKAAQNQLKQVLDAFSSRNAEEAEAVWNRDGEIDEIYNSLFRELLTYMMEDPRTIGSSTHLLFIAKNIERSGDHATNIAEVVYHMVRADHLSSNRPKADTTSETSVPFERKA